jgi:hypothetical protein
LPQNTEGVSGYGTKGAAPVAPCLLPGAPLAPQWFTEAQAALKPGECIKRSHAVCYTCYNRKNEQRMRETGRAVLYLSDCVGVAADRSVSRDRLRVTNWPGSLSLPVSSVRHSRNNFGAQRTDVWFRFDGADWHGVNVGDNQILRCKRLKGK